MNYTWSIETHVGLVRSNNQDAFAPDNDDSAAGPVVIAIADGMGGHVGGEVASRTAIAAAIAETDGEPVQRVERADQAVIEAMVADPSLQGMGTTLTLALLTAEGTARIAHVGDSRAYLLRDGELRQLTDDHSVVGELVRAGLLTPEEARHHPRRNLVTRSVGMGDVSVDLVEEDLLPGDRLLLCSDGLTDMVDDDDITRLLGEGGAPSEAAWDLIDAANAAGGRDNTTVAVVDVTP